MDDRLALIVGINTYQNVSNLTACVSDAEEMERLLSRHKDGAKNFDCIVFADKTERGAKITRGALREELEKRFESRGDILFYFSGHGFLTSTGGVLCTSDATKSDWGIPMQEVTDLAIGSNARHILIILDCCHSGDFANSTVANTRRDQDPLAVVRENMTVIAASRGKEAAVEEGGRSLFTGAILDALDGGGADHMGFVTAPALYTYARRRFSARDQRPVYKTNATEVFVVRECEPLIQRLLLTDLPKHFPNIDHKFHLDPEYEPEDEFGNMKLPVNNEKIATAQLFKLYRDAGLLKPSVPGSQLYWAARRSETVELTPIGREYWWLVKNDKI